MSKTKQRKSLTHKPYARKPYVRQYAPPIPKEEGPRQAVIYTRVSSKEQAAEGYSIPAQQKILRTYAAEHDLKSPLGNQRRRSCAALRGALREPQRRQPRSRELSAIAMQLYILISI